MRPNGNSAVRLDPDRPRVIAVRTHCVVRVADGEVLAYGNEEAMRKFTDCLGGGDAYSVMVRAKGEAA